MVTMENCEKVFLQLSRVGGSAVSGEQVRHSSVVGASVSYSIGWVERLKGLSDMKEDIDDV